jgi:protein-disulfide isomerase
MPRRKRALPLLITEERGKAELAAKELNVAPGQLYEAMRKSWRGFAMVEEAAKGSSVQPGGVAPPAAIVPASTLGPAPVRGDAKAAKVVIVACSDYDCPACARGAKTLAQLATRYGEKIAIEHRHFATAASGRGAPAQLAAIAADKQGKFWALHDSLYENRSARSDAALDKLAVAAGLELEAWKRDRADPALRARITEDTAACTALGVTSLPSYVVAGTVVRGAPTPERLAKIIDPLLAK